MAQDQARQLAELYTAQAQALADGDVTAATHIGGQIEVLASRQSRLTRQLRTAALTSSPRSRQRPQREVAADLLREIGFAAPVRFVSDLSIALDGVGIPLTNFGAIRKSEQVQYRRNSTAKLAWLLPGVWADVFTPAGRWLTLSTWSLADRVITQYTSRAAALRALIHVADHLERTDADTPTADRLQALALRTAIGLPTLQATARTDVPTLAERARSELADIGPAEDAERQAAVAVLADWPESVQHWGREVLHTAHSTDRRAADRER